MYVNGQAQSFGDLRFRVLPGTGTPEQPTPPGAVHEPSTMALFGLTSVAFFVSRKRFKA